MHRLTSKFNVQILEENEFPLWNEFVKNSAQGTFFNTTQWAEILSGTYNRPFEIAVCRNDGSILAGMLIFQNQKLFWQISTALQFYPFSGPICYTPADEKTQKSIARQIEYSTALAEYLASKYNFYQFQTHYSLKDVRVFQWENHQVCPFFTYIISFDKEKNIAEQFSQSVRRKIKAAEEAGAELAHSDDPNQLCDLVIGSYRRHGTRAPVSEPVLRAFTKKVIELPESELRYVKVKSAIKAGRLFLKDRNTVYDILAGSDADDQFSSAYLVARSLSDFSANFQFFDFLGAGHPEIEQFKRGFGGSLETAFLVESRARFPLNLLLNLRRRQISKEREL